MSVSKTLKSSSSSGLCNVNKSSQYHSKAMQIGLPTTLQKSNNWPIYLICAYLDLNYFSIHLRLCSISYLVNNGSNFDWIPYMITLYIYYLTQYIKTCSVLARTSYEVGEERNCLGTCTYVHITTLINILSQNIIVS